MATASRSQKHGSAENGSAACKPSSDADRQKAAQFLRQAEKNKTEIKKLEKERALIRQCKRNGWTDLCGELEQYEKVLEHGKDAEKIHLQNQLLRIRSDGRKFKNQLREVKPTPKTIQTLMELMSEVERSISSLKEEQWQRFEELLKEERTCRQELRAYEKKIENWSHSVKSDPKGNTASSPKTKLLDRDLPADVKVLESFLQRTGGVYGGWDQYDHQAFLKAWTKHSGQPAYRKEAKLHLPAKTLEEIEQHEEWHRELSYLQGRKREAILRWKARKTQERQIWIQTQQEAEKREKEPTSQAHQHRTDEEKREATRRLEEWREERRRNKELEEEQRLAEEVQKRRQAKEERRRQLEVKSTIEERLRLRREEEEEQRRRAREEERKEMEERRRLAAQCIKDLNQRDLLKVEAKLQDKQLKEKEVAERQLRIVAKLKEKVDGHVSRDPTRLTRPTKGWEERLKSIGPSGKGPVTQTFHRAVPTWRQGL
ncbi:coiled-coil domain-containing protein 112-like [Takifugu flavidus]|uniref:coiled-coil domain-containing protein 112-like n=1 Tax=Takifugu flavidus TaxID=433684 RepID=UPI0025441207|nr:coiled-coil domain-containing protein 112-like [Takifugu flavidus]